LNSDLQTDARFLELITANGPKILKICRVYAWERPDQDDLYQEILCQVWRAFPDLKEQAYANTWLYRVALNTAITFVRKHKSRQKHVISCDDEMIQQVPEPKPSHDPQTDEQLSELFRAISQLNETEKAVITLFLEELSYEEMASVLGITESNVGVLLHRAKKKLFTLMKEAPCRTIS
jgi:RNA polymerase sigma-70 factor, ECF subfamily